MAEPGAGGGGGGGGAGRWSFTPNFSKKNQDSPSLHDHVIARDRSLTFLVITIRDYSYQY